MAGNSKLVGVITSIGPGTRPLRDEITGEMLPTPENEAVLVIRATVIFSFDQRPDTVTLVAPQKTGRANIGFVLYHQGVPVNDYRYLSTGLTVELDWDDAWYSAFPQRGLRRQYYAPMTGFIYVEPYEVRKEIIVRPADVQQYVDLGLDGASTIPADRHDEIKKKVVEFLSDHFPVTIDGQPVEGEVDRVNFLRRTLRSSVVVDNQDLELLSATLGVIYVFPTDGLPNEVEMVWDWFTDKTPTIPAATVDQAGPLPHYSRTQLQYSALGKLSEISGASYTRRYRETANRSAGNCWVGTMANAGVEHWFVGTAVMVFRFQAYDVAPAGSRLPADRRTFVIVFPTTSSGRAE